GALRRREKWGRAPPGSSEANQPAAACSLTWGYADLRVEAEVDGRAYDFMQLKIGESVKTISFVSPRVSSHLSAARRLRVETPSAPRGRFGPGRGLLHL